MRTMTLEETQDTIVANGLDRMRGVAVSFTNPAPGQFYAWHDHPYHQLLYASDGQAVIETQAGRHVVPQGCSAWLPVGLPHRSLFSSFTAASIYLSPEIVMDNSGRARVLAADPLLREMVLFSRRWEKGRGDNDPLAASFYQTFAGLCERWLENELPLSLPTSAHSGIARAMDSALVDPGSATLAKAIDLAGTSERTFRRLFCRETGMTWNAWIGQARILKAMSLLAEGRMVTNVSAEVGYSSMSAFAKAFCLVTGEAPARYRARHHRPAASPAEVA